MKSHPIIKSPILLDGELELVNSYARRPLSEDEVFIFTVALCDNEVDRDYERFTVESLEKLATLFVGKCGIFDHDPSAKNQSARIISAKVEAVAGKKNLLGDDYFRLTARAYMPKTEGNRELRDAIDSGIIREVSVGCSVERTVCSICGEEMSSQLCSHRRGETYSGKLCYGELVEPLDAYEFSFVAVPAQKEAGVIKSFGKEKSMEDILKSIEKGEAVTLTKTDSEMLCSYIEGLKKQSADGALYRSRLEKEVKKYYALCEPELSEKTVGDMVKAVSTEALCELERVFRAKSGEMLPPTPQLAPKRSAVNDNKNSQFKI